MLSWTIAGWPLNPFLSLRHINVEVSSIKAVEYLYKYVYKGHDRTQIRVEHNACNTNGPTAHQQPEGPVQHDEIADYLDARYCSFPFPTH